MIGQYGDIYILDHFAKDRVEIGYYSLATIFFSGASQVTSTVQSIATPYFSERAHKKDWFYNQLIRNQTRMIVLSFPVATIVYIAAFLLIEIFYGSAYQTSLTYLAIMLIKYVIWSSFAIIGIALIGLGMVHYNFVAVTITTPLGLIMSYIMLQHYGVSGVAWAQVGTSIITLIIMLLFCQIAIKQAF